MSNKTFHQTLCVELVYSQSGLLRGAPPWARPRWRSRWSSVASRRGRRAAGWRWCRWRLKAAGSGPPGGRTFLYNTWLKLLLFLSLGCSVDLTPLSRGSRWKVQETKKRRWTREKERAKESEREEITCGGSRHETQIQAVTVTAGNREGTKARCWRGCYRSLMSELGVSSHVLDKDEKSWRRDLYL